MSDSDSELILPSNNFTFQNDSTMVSVRGPGIIANNIPGISFQNNVLSSTKLMPQGFERQRYATSNYDQRSISGRRDASLMSIKRARVARQTARSVVSGRSGSHMSQRSIRSSASVLSVADISNALENGNFSEREVRKLNFAHYRMLKNLRRKRKKSCDSGDQGSNSSPSSDDSSTRTSNYVENMSSCRSTKTYKSCSQKNMTSLKVPANFNSSQKKQTVPEITQKDMFRNGFLLPSQRFNQSVASSAIQENAEKVQSQKDRFKSKFLLPSERFKKFVPSSFVQEDTGVSFDNLHNAVQMNKNTATNFNVDSDSDDDIFTKATNKQTINDNIRRKRYVDRDDDDDICLPNSKKIRVASPCRNSVETRKANKANSNNDGVASDFVFAKPEFPVRKIVKEKLISKSGPSTLDTYLQESAISSTNEESQQRKSIEQDQVNQCEPSNATQNTTDLSMRPSFIKRKLFTQKLDVSEKRNMSTDSVNSPMNSIYGDIQKEKHKARKLQQATTQSCLSRDVQQDENNLLDLIQRVVPLEQMNATNHTNRTELQNGTNRNSESEDKWDVTSIISARKNDEDGSDTYTDEEIFNSTVRELTKHGTKTSSSIKGKKVSKAVSNQILPTKGKHPALMKPSPLKTAKALQKETVTQKLSPVKTNHATSKIDVQKCVMSFWDTDFESEEECQQPPRFGNYSKQNQSRVTIHPNEVNKFPEFSSVLNSKNNDDTNLPNSNNANISKFNTTNFRIKYHRIPERKKLDQAKDDNTKSALFEPQSEIQETLYTENSFDDKNEKCKETDTKASYKRDSKHLQESNRHAPKINKRNKNSQSVEVSSSEKQADNKITQLNNNEKEIVQSKRGRKKGTTNKENKTKTTQKSDNIQDTTIVLQPITDSQKLTETKDSSKNKRNLTNKKSVQDNTRNKKQTNETTTEKQAPKRKYVKKAKQDKSLNADTSIEQNNNSGYRPMRSCRMSKTNQTFDNSNLGLDSTIVKTLRSRQIDISSTFNGNTTKASRRVVNLTKDAKSRPSDVSFLLNAGIKTVAKVKLKKLKNLQLLRSEDVETSDISFTLRTNESPPSKRAISAVTRLNSKTNKKQNEIRNPTPLKNSLQTKNIFVSKNESKPRRNRLPNKKYLNC